MKNIVIGVLGFLFVGTLMLLVHALTLQYDQNRAICARFAELSRGEEQPVVVACREDRTLTYIRVVRFERHEEVGPGYTKSWSEGDGYEYTPKGETPWHQEY